MRSNPSPVQIFFLLVFLWFSCVAQDAKGAAKKKKVLTPKTTRLNDMKDPTTTQKKRKQTEILNTVLTRYRVNSLFGLNIVRGSGFFVGTQIGVRAKRSLRFYIGPELNFTLFPSGHLFNVMGSTWFEIPLPDSTDLSLHLGALAGIGFSENVPNLARTHFTCYFDIAVAQDIDDLVTIRGQIRPGLVAGKMAFMMNFNVGFRL